MKKKLLTIGTSVLLVAGGAAVYLSSTNKKEKAEPEITEQTPVAIKVKETVEYGTDLTNKTLILKTASGETEVNFSNLTPAVDTSKVGETKHALVLQNETFEVTIAVEDTQMPVVLGIKERFEMDFGTDVEAELKKMITAKDPVDGNLEVTFDIKQKENIPNEYTVMVTASDANQNETTASFEVFVETIAEVDTVAAKPPTNQSNAGSNSNSSSTGGKTETPAQKPKPTPAQKPESKPETNPNPESKPNDTISLVGVPVISIIGTVPGATLISQSHGEILYSFPKNFPSGGKVENVSLLGNSRGKFSVVIKGKDKNGGIVYASQEKGGQLLYKFALPDFNDDDFSTIQNWASQFLNAHSE